MKETEIKKRIKYFEDRVRYYFFEVFKMYEYDLTINKDTDKTEALAYTSYHPSSEGASQISIYYCDLLIMKSENNYSDIDKTAYHEVLESLLSELKMLAVARYVTEPELMRANHRIIERLTNIHYPTICSKEAKL
jgi:hypothetical protein